ncbi:MAG: hypothetical protein LBD67_04585 [Candidatus Accumulibacter sp.]|jgi:hypothetical protein|nr:hypothetical protein [Accumulibacter sp.]
MNDFSNPDSFFESFFNPYPSTSFLRQAQDRQGERIENEPLTCFLRQAQDGAGRTDWKGVLRQHLSPFVLSLSKYERTLQIMNDFSNPDSFFESFFNPYPSINSGRTDWKVVLRQHLSPFVLSLSKYERTLRLSRPCSSNRFSILTLRQASFDRLRTGQGERTGKKVSRNPKRLKIA